MRTRRFLSIFACMAFLAPAVASAVGDAGMLFQTAKPVAMQFSDGTMAWAGNTLGVRKLENGVVVVKSSRLTLDTDGASKEVRSCDQDSQAETSLTDREGRPIDSNSIPYFVLPWCSNAADSKSCRDLPPYQQLGLRLGDLAAIVANNKTAFAIAADLGPEKQFGEGSIELHRQLGHETLGKSAANSKCAANESLESEITMVIFPNSNTGFLSAEDIKRRGAEMWDQLLKSPYAAPSAVSLGQVTKEAKLQTAASALRSVNVGEGAPGSATNQSSDENILNVLNEQKKAALNSALEVKASGGMISENDFETLNKASRDVKEACDQKFKHYYRQRNNRIGWSVTTALVGSVAGSVIGPAILAGGGSKVAAAAFSGISGATNTAQQVVAEQGVTADAARASSSKVRDAVHQALTEYREAYINTALATSERLIKMKAALMKADDACFLGEY